MKNTILSLLGLFIFISSAGAEHHGDSAGKLSFISSAKMQLDEIKANDIRFSTAELEGLSNVNSSTYGPIPVGTVFAFNCAASSLEKDGQSTVYGFCRVKDKDNDEFSIENTRVGRLGVPGTGNSVMRGISGKYANLMGVCKFTPTYLINDGVFISVAYDCDMKH